MYLKYAIIITLFLSNYCFAQSQTANLIERAKAIHNQVITIDSHLDTPLNLMRSNFDLSVKHEIGRRGGRFDLPRMKEGGLDAAFFAVFTGQGARNPEAHLKVKNKALKILDKIHEVTKENEEQVELAYSSDDIKRLAGENKSAIVIGMENGYPVGHNITLVKTYFDLGIRYITLCHTKNNDICDSSTDESGPEFHGLSPFGDSVVTEMNRLGIMIDVSHVSDETVLDVLKLSKAPIIASHSCVKALRDHPRNLSDSLIQTIAEKGGVVQVCIMSDYLKNIEQNPERKIRRDQLRNEYGSYNEMSPERRKEFFQKLEKLEKEHPQKLATVSDFVDNIDYIVELVGIDYVGIGSDFDGGGRIDGCRDVSEMPNITIELVKRGYSEEQIRKIWGGNFLRVFTEVEKTAERLTSSN